jgi:hypothetical protein
MGGYTTGAVVQALRQYETMNFLKMTLLYLYSRTTVLDILLKYIVTDGWRTGI